MICPVVGALRGSRYVAVLDGAFSPRSFDIVLFHCILTGHEMLDLTNTFHFMQNLNHATAYSVVARCKDSSGRELEIEFVTSLVL